MTTLVIHGTFAQGASWYWNSWKPGGFCYALSKAMEDISGSHDVWRVNGKSIAATGRFEWSGAPDGMLRGDGSHALVRYLNALRRQTNERIRIVAHSHGCNVVKLASMHTGLSPDIHIDKAVFLACPHFWEPNYEPEKPASWTDKFKLELLRPRGRKYRYRVSPQRFKRILNLYSERDRVQVNMAEALSCGIVPMTGNFLQDVGNILRTGDLYEVATAERIDTDPSARGLYENYAVPTSATCGEREVHTAMHGFVVGALCGLWLDSKADVRTLISKYGPFPRIDASDTGA
jgi:hypothetical protein